MQPFRILPDGDAALLVELRPVIDPALNAWCVALAAAARAQLGSALRDVVIGYSCVTVYFDPMQVDGRWIEIELRGLADALPPPRSLRGADVEVPVCYGGHLGPDIGDVASFGRCTADEVAQLHAAVTYRVYLVGFVPGFAYLATVDPRIAAPRRPVPRTIVPAGSVGIAGGQTGIYPDATPGGWNIIGRTPVQPFDAARAEPSLFRVGDQVRFRPVEASEFADLAARTSNPEPF